MVTKGKANDPNDVVMVMNSLDQHNGTKCQNFTKVAPRY